MKRIYKEFDNIYIKNFEGTLLRPSIIKLLESNNIHTLGQLFTFTDKKDFIQIILERREQDNLSIASTYIELNNVQNY